MGKPGMNWNEEAVIKSCRNRRPNQNSRLNIQYISECRKNVTSSINMLLRIIKENRKDKLRLYCLKDTAYRTRALEASLLPGRTATDRLMLDAHSDHQATGNQGYFQDLKL